MLELDFTAETLPPAIRRLFELNGYDVRENIHIHGAQVDLIAESKASPFAPTIYIEATIEYVSNTKYAKDLTKFALLQKQDASCVCLLISSNGFTAEVRERATATGIKTMTYAELFRSFEKFSYYVDRILEDRELKQFENSYEEPFFDDSNGHERATDWIMSWASDNSTDRRWIIVLGEYGTGKTALTQVIQRRLVEKYRKSPDEPIPLRIELRDFSRQFDSRTLLHHFLDTNGLTHISIDFLLQLIRTGRVILLLDGYDEMAQFLNTRERRACLSALADLASGGAKGVLTSRPNYFTESEEFHVFEALYKMFKDNEYYISKSDEGYLETERRVDIAVTRLLLNRFERVLQDLSPVQTLALVERKLKDDLVGQGIVISILKSVFRTVAGENRSLSGKPVIITYLLDLIDELKAQPEEEMNGNPRVLGEWVIYKMIIDRLMLRDQKRTPGIEPKIRRACLHQLAIILSQRDVRIATDSIFYSIIDQEFRAYLRVLDADHRVSERISLFENLRSSATLTRSTENSQAGWAFSHNSLREYLVAEYFIGKCRAKDFPDIKVPISEPMKSFVASMDRSVIESCINSITAVWPYREAKPSLGTYVCLLWEAFGRLGDGQKTDSVLKKFGGGDLLLDSIRVQEISFNINNLSSNKISINMRNSEASRLSFGALDLSNSAFENSLLDSILFYDCNLTSSSFDGALIYECDFSNCVFDGASFKALAEKPCIYVSINGSRVYLEGDSAAGYLKYQGAIVDEIDDYFVYGHHPKFDIVAKILEKLAEQPLREIRGLTQRGVARDDPPFAREFVDFMIRKGMVEVIRAEAVRTTPIGRELVSEFVHERLPEPFSEFLEQRR
ncbi:restriction endonuclease [Methylosinus sp. sav-2]|uniref:NACHT domain-containing protein n=1 Tax=Methylosinus sp. sav-2 TaxID=2485168 RepID=UPI000A56D402|nr:NACHT domain-containing protein [Methylosinus sp. sav-2]TDX64313.1 restriction endonuclease [Methylosinus sp. sav-2]